MRLPLLKVNVQEAIFGRADFVASVRVAKISTENQEGLPALQLSVNPLKTNRVCVI